MSHRFAAIAVLCLVFSSPIAGTPANTPITVANPGFESGLQGWTVATPSGPVGGGSVSGASPGHSGGSSIAIRHSGALTTTVVSPPVILQVGKMYRASCWIRTDNVQADPISRYPTAVPATIRMSSLPFTMTGSTVGGTRDWTRCEILFYATSATDRIELCLGANGTATGTAWFDDVELSEVSDIRAMIPMETVKWYGPAFRYTDGGWIFVHIEGAPYQRGYQYGTLLSKEIVSYLDKLAVRANAENPVAGWGAMRTLTDATMYRKYDPELLDEMKGIADGAARAGAKHRERVIDVLDIVTLNSAVDLGTLSDALTRTRTPLSGRSFRTEEDEVNAAERLHKCSSFLANGPASKDGRIVFGQLFMWQGYTGVHWDVICDVVPSKGHRLVYETFPGGIHSGADFYLNDAGVMIGETTVAQTPFNLDGEPQSSRIRRAAQYGESVDDVVKILGEKNNGLYTNDWLIGDVRANEIAILLLGTDAHKLWRSSQGEFPGGTTGFYWSVNNAKDPLVRREYVAGPSNAPYDVAFSPTNRDLSFMDLYRRRKGQIDGLTAVRELATSPINRPHACDGKVTTAAMAERLMFFASYGKVTLREKWVEKNARLMPDLPNAQPHLALGYSIINPVFVTEKLQELHRKAAAPPPAAVKKTEVTIAEHASFDKKLLWFNTVYPQTDADNWFVSGSAAYWHLLDTLPADPVAATTAQRDYFAEITNRELYLGDREGALAPSQAARRYDRFSSYVFPRIRGLFALHQLRLMLGNASFSRVMNAIHTTYREKPMSTAQFVALAEKTSGKKLDDFVGQWLDRNDVPQVEWSIQLTNTDSVHTAKITARQPGLPYHAFVHYLVETKKNKTWHTMEIQGKETAVTFRSDSPIERVTANAANDIPSRKSDHYVLSNLFDDFKNAIIVYGTTRQIEAQHSMALRYQTVIADQFTEDLLPVVQDAAVSDSLMATKDLVILGGVADNLLTAKYAKALGIEAGKNMFRWQGKTYADADDGLVVVKPNPANPKRVVYCFIANSSLQLYHMTKRHTALPSWGLFKGETLVDKGYF